MIVNKIILENYSILQISGTLSVENIDSFEKELSEALNQKLHVIVDFNDLKFIDSSSLGMIVLYFSKYEKEGIILLLTNINNDIFQMFSLTGIGRRVPIFSDNEEAVTFIKSRQK